MKQLWVVFVLLWCVASLQAQDKTVKGNQYTLKGKIVSRVYLPAGCGIFAWATVVEMQIISYSDSAYTGKRIGVIFTCPREYGKNFFQIGKVYDVQVADQNQASFGWTFNNAEVLKKYKTAYQPWVISAKRSK